MSSNSAAEGEPHARLAAITALHDAGPLAAAHARLLRNIAFNKSDDTDAHAGSDTSMAPTTTNAGTDAPVTTDAVAAAAVGTVITRTVILGYGNERCDEAPDMRVAALLAWRAVASLTRAEMDDAVRTLAACLLPDPDAASGRGASRGASRSAAPVRYHTNATQGEVVAAVDFVGRLGKHAPLDLARACVSFVNPQNHPTTNGGGGSDFRLLWAAAVEAACRIATHLPAPAPTLLAGTPQTVGVSGDQPASAAAAANAVVTLPPEAAREDGDPSHWLAGSADASHWPVAAGPALHIPSSAAAVAAAAAAAVAAIAAAAAAAAADHAVSARVLAVLAGMIRPDQRSAHARGGAARVLGRAPPTLLTPHLPALVALATDPLPWVRHAAAVTLGAMPPALLDVNGGLALEDGIDGGLSLVNGCQPSATQPTSGGGARPKVTELGVNHAVVAAASVTSQLDRMAALLTVLSYTKP